MNDSENKVADNFIRDIDIFMNKISNQISTSDENLETIADTPNSQIQTALKLAANPLSYPSTILILMITLVYAIQKTLKV